MEVSKKRNVIKAPHRVTEICQRSENEWVGLVGEPAGGTLTQREVRAATMGTGAKALGVVRDRHKIQGSAQLHDFTTGGA